MFFGGHIESSRAGRVIERVLVSKTKQNNHKNSENCSQRDMETGRNRDTQRQRDRACQESCALRKSGFMN